MSEDPALKARHDSMVDAIGKVVAQGCISPGTPLTAFPLQVIESAVVGVICATTEPEGWDTVARIMMTAVRTRLKLAKAQRINAPSSQRPN